MASHFSHLEYLVGGRIPVEMTLRPRCDRWDSANLSWIAGCKAGSQSGLPVSPRRERWDPTSIGKISNVGELTKRDVYKHQKEKLEEDLHKGAYTKRKRKAGGELTQGDVYKQQIEKQEGGLHRGTYAKKEEKS